MLPGGPGIAPHSPRFTLASTRPDVLQTELRRERQVVYAGIDPTAQSLHVGHLLPLLCLFHFQIRGHQIIPLVRCCFANDTDSHPYTRQIGGATGLIGDPSGRATERPLSEQAVVENNVRELTVAVKRFFSRAIDYAQKRLGVSRDDIREPHVENNLHWLKNLGLLEFLRTIGVHSRVNTMMARDRYAQCLTGSFMNKTLSPVYGRASSPNRASPSRNSHINSCNPTIF